MDENNNIHNLDKETLSDKAYKILVELIVSQKFRHKCDSYTRSL